MFQKQHFLTWYKFCNIHAFKKFSSLCLLTLHFLLFLLFRCPCQYIWTNLVIHQNCLPSVCTLALLLLLNNVSLCGGVYHDAIIVLYQREHFFLLTWRACSTSKCLCYQLHALIVPVLVYIPTRNIFIYWCCVYQYSGITNNLSPGKLTTTTCAGAEAEMTEGWVWEEFTRLNYPCKRFSLDNKPFNK